MRQVQPSILERTGTVVVVPAIEVTVRAETASATFIVAGRELKYQITTGSVNNPLNLAALRDFRCPSGICSSDAMRSYSASCPQNAILWR